MKKITFLILYLTLSVGAYSQNYNTDQLKALSIIWGETYLFHPSIIRSDKNIQWEQDLVEFLPHIKNSSSEEEFMTLVNSHLLAKLQDPFTLVQSVDETTIANSAAFHTNREFEYIRIAGNQFEDIGSITAIDSKINDKNSNKPLVIDLRITKELALDWHSNTLFEFFAAMLIETQIPSSTSVTREHFGWDETNDWWYYEQRWKVKNRDRQLADNSHIKPFTEYAPEIQQNVQDFNFETFKPIQRPVYLLTNNSFLSYYETVLLALQTNRPNLFIINENKGAIFTPENANLMKYQFGKYEFILNTGFYLNGGHSELTYALNVNSIQPENVTELVKSTASHVAQDKSFSFEIVPGKYETSNEELSLEEKIMGIIKTWTIVKYFYVHPDLCSIDWENSLGDFLELAQKTISDQEYYTMIQEMMATLNDSHVSTFHPSVLDFSKIFVAPIQFEYVRNRVIITSIDDTISADISLGDEIVSIDDLTIVDILKKEKKRISSSNNQGFISTVINPGYFIGAEGSVMKLGIVSGTGKEFVEVPRTMYIFQLMSFGDKREASNIFENSIGYLNLAFLADADQLETELLKMQNTRALIIDLRNSYPTHDFNRFLQMLCIQKSKIRIDEVPIVSAKHTGNKQIHMSEYELTPDPLFTYTKPIAVLIDKTMISRPEDIAIALQSFPNVTFIGEQTQGTDGEMTKIYLPGGGETSFTGQVVKFGSGETFQGKGIQPDIGVQRTVEGIKRGRDEILEKAIEYCSGKE